MARPALRHEANAVGPWYVDERCIDCGTCRDLAPATFAELGGQSVVVAQPSDGATELGAWLAAQACPTSSIGTLDHRARPGRLYPREVAAGSGVFDLGFCAESSFGASAWFVPRPSGNLMIDAPRFTEALAGPIGERGGIAHLLLTHRDDVADGQRWAERFGARVWIHRADSDAAPFATDLFDGPTGMNAEDDVDVAPGVVAVPVPGHTRGSVVYIVDLLVDQVVDQVVDQRWAFTGDSLAWSHERADLVAFRRACWYSWRQQTASLAALAARHRFAAVLPGHGARVLGDPDDLHARLLALVARMAATP
jgi:glyoxylase-like metal-dependent hydrolase (beta-lactamase superfamily II)/ferredoxin